jgi:hypothetical protein
MKTINLNEIDLKPISHMEMIQINGGEWNKGFNAGVKHGEAAGKGIQAGLTLIAIYMLLVL